MAGWQWHRAALARYGRDIFLKLWVWQVTLLLLPSLPLLALGYSGTIVGAVRALVPETDIDSWRPIHLAMDYVATHASATGLYRETYFNSSAQFIYSPQSLAAFIWLKRLLRLDLGDVGQAGTFSWCALLGLVPLAFCSFRLLERDLGGGGDPRRSPAWTVLAASLVSVFGFWPVTWGFRVGNIQNILTLLTLLALVLHLRGRSGLAGVLLGLVALVKPNLAVIVVWALLRREWSLVAGLAVTGLVASAISIAMFGWHVHAEYLDLLHYLSGRGESYFSSHSFESTLYRALHDGNNLNWDGTHRQLQPVAWVHTLATVLGLGVLIATFWPRRTATVSQRFMDFGAAVLAIVAASPVAYEHHYGLAFIVIPGGLLIAWRNGASRSTVAMLAAADALMGGYFKPVDLATANTALNVLQSYRLYGVLLLLWSLWRLQDSLRSAVPERGVASAFAAIASHGDARHASIGKRGAPTAPALTSADGRVR